MAQSSRAKRPSFKGKTKPAVTPHSTEERTPLVRLGGAWKQKYGLRISIDKEGMEALAAAIETIYESDAANLGIYLFYNREKTKPNSPDYGVLIKGPEEA